MFEIKKIQSETLGEYLLAVRTSLNLSLDEVSRDTSIQKKFLEDFESGRIDHLPAEVYAIGFLKKLAALYTVPEDDLVTQFKKERGIATQLVKAHVTPIKMRPVFAITPKTLGIGVVGIFVLGTLAYVGLQLRSMSTNPRIVVSEPASGSRVTGSFVKVAGKTDAGNTMVINGKDVFVKEDGSFETMVSIAPGQTELVFVARNKFEKSSAASTSVIRDDGVVLAAEELAPNPLVLSISALESVTIAVTVDGKVQNPYVLPKGQSREVLAESRLLLSTSDAGNTKVAINGQDAGVLGREGEELTDVPFTNDANGTLPPQASRTNNNNF
jgi:transcriptional regulator with XRE-family HTH domain